MKHQRDHIKETIGFIAVVLCCIGPLGTMAATASGRPYSRPKMARHEWVIDFLTLGKSALQFNSSQTWSKPKQAWECGMGAGYTYWWTRHFGISCGIEATYMQYTAAAKSVNTESHGVTEVGIAPARRMERCSAEVTTAGIEEEFTLSMFHLPLQLSIKAHHLQLSAGISLSSSITTFSSYRYGTSYYHITSFDDLGITLGGGTVYGNSVKGTSGYEGVNTTFHPLFVNLAIDLRWRMYFDNRNAVSIDLFMRESINRYRLASTKPELVEITPGPVGDNIRNQSPLFSGLVESLSYYEFGGRICYHIGCGRNVKGHM
ncbi:MAG: hypothetical protein IJ620_04765 [Bacteroidales bacterium]|nr:hypothetical protein [Bacteroidales bacterium]